MLFSVCRAGVFRIPVLLGLQFFKNTHVSDTCRQFHLGVLHHDWIRRNTPRKPSLYRVKKEFTLLEEDYIEEKFPEYKSFPNEDSVVERTFSLVNNAIESNTSRYFAVVHLAGKQFKVTTDDLIMVKTPLFGADVGDHLRLEKVLLLGAKDFTLIGRPLLDKNTVNVEAVVVEKTLEHPHLWFQFHRRRRHRKMRGMLSTIVPGRSSR